MNIKIVVSLVIAALLFVGCAASSDINDNAVPANHQEKSANLVDSDAKSIAGTSAMADKLTELTAEEAQEAAFNHAGINPEDATQIHLQRETEDDIPVWEVEFRSGDYEYDYTLHAVTGEILDRDKEYDPAEVPPVETPPVETPPVETPPVETPPAELTKEEAVAIALKDAGLTEAEITVLKAEKDADDGKLHWEVEFRSGDYEYDYTLHAVTGEILDRDKEYDPAEVPPVETPPAETPPAQPAVPTLLTADEALALALDHAGLAVGQVADLETEMDEEDGEVIWEVEFFGKGFEYSYCVHAQTGEILEWEKEKDD